MAIVNRLSNSFIADKITKSSYSATNGSFTNMARNPRRFVGLRLADALCEMGYMLDYPQGSTQKIMYHMFHSMGYTITTSEADYSLLSEATIENVNNNQPTLLSDLNTVTFSNELLSLQDKFPNLNDPIYEADSNPPQNVDLKPFEWMSPEEAKTLDLVYAGSNLARLGLAVQKRKQTSRYCDNQQLKKALKKLKR